MTTTPGDQTTDTRPQRRISPLVLAVPLIAVAYVAVFLFTNRGAPATGAPPLAQLNTADAHALAFSPVDAATVFFGHHDGLLISRDQGATWQPANLRGADTMSLAASPQNPQRMYAAGHGIFYRSDDGGTSWSKVAGALQDADIHAFAASPEDADRVYAFIENQGILTSADGGATWQPLPQGGLPEMAALAAGPGQTLYAGTSFGDVYESVDGGQSWRRDNLGVGMQVTSLAFDQRSATLYATAATSVNAKSMLHRRQVGGGPWETLPFDGQDALVALSVSPQDSKTILAVNRRAELYRSRDGGATWGMN